VHRVHLLADAAPPPPLQVGTIFGVWPGDKLKGITGRDQAAAGMGVFGPRTCFVIALKDAPGCHEFLLQDDGARAQRTSLYDGLLTGPRRMPRHYAPPPAGAMPPAAARCLPGGGPHDRSLYVRDWSAGACQ
jgi:Fructose-1-6-bisphosphatase, N-terminal domain